MSSCMMRDEDSTTSCRNTVSSNPKRLPKTARRSSVMAKIKSFLAEMDGRMDGTLCRELGRKL